jgi:hypothetical protein
LRARLKRTTIADRPLAARARRVSDGVPSGQEHEVVHVGTGHAHRAGILHDQQPGLLSATDRARERLLRLDHDQVRPPGSALSQARTLRLVEIRREPVRLVGLLELGIAAGRKSQLAWRARGGRVGVLAGLQPSLTRPRLEEPDRGRDPRGLDEHDVLQDSGRSAAPAFDIRRVKPTQPAQNVDRRDELVLGESVLRRPPHASLQPHVALSRHRR